MTTLKELCLLSKNRTDKYDIGYIDEFYSSLLEGKQEIYKSIFEIGVQNGYSAMLWHDYFSNAIVTCVDINECPNLVDRERINFYQKDAYTKEFLSQFDPNSFDLVIDDGPHTLDSMKFFLENYLNLVKSGGILVLEDIVDVEWTPQLISMIDLNFGKITTYNMGGKAVTEKLKKEWLKGLDVIIVEKY